MGSNRLSIILSLIRLIIGENNSRISWTRSLFYSIKFKKRLLCSCAVRFEIDDPRDLVLEANSYACFGYRGFDCRRPTYVRVQKGGKLILDNNVSFNSGCVVFVQKPGILKIGADTYFNEDTKIVCSSHTVIGKDCAISWGVSILDNDGHHFLKNKQVNLAKNGITIKDHVWIGVQSTILKGTYIGQDSIIGATSLVKGKIEANSINMRESDKLIQGNYNWKK